MFKIFLFICLFDDARAFLEDQVKGFGKSGVESALELLRYFVCEQTAKISLVLPAAFGDEISFLCEQAFPFSFPGTFSHTLGILSLPETADRINRRCARLSLRG